MDKMDAIAALSALAQATRLDAFRLLVQHEPTGLAAGEIARVLGVPHNTLSTHLGVLSGAGLITCERRSRSLLYRASLTCFRDLTGFLFRDCCGGRPEFCDPAIEVIASCCPP